MSLLAYNLTGSPVTLAGTSIILPASASPPSPGEAVNVTSELKGLTEGEYAALEAQRPDTVLYEWTSEAEFDLGDLEAYDGGSTPTFASARFTFTKDTSPGTNYERVILYVRTAGSDATGDGSEESPWRTLQHALNQIPTLMGGAGRSFGAKHYIVDITGINDVISAEHGIMCPPFRYDAPLFGDYTFNQYQPMLGGLLTIFAELQDGDALPALTTWTTNNKNTITYDFSGAAPGWTLNEFKGKQFKGSEVDQTAVVVSNTADTITVSGAGVAGAFDAPYYIADYGATLTRATGGGSVLNFRGVDASVVVSGVKLAHEDEGTQSVFSQGIKDIVFSHCNVTGWDLQRAGNVMFNTTYAHCPSFGCPAYVYADRFVFWGHMEGARLVTSGYTELWWLSANNCQIGERLYGQFHTWNQNEGDLPAASAMKIHKSEISGIYSLIFDYGVQIVENVNFDISGGVSHAIQVKNGAILLLSTGNTGGADGSYGLRVLGGSTVIAYDTVLSAPTGTLGDMKVGARPVRSYATWNSATYGSPYKERDISGDGSMIISISEGSNYDGPMYVPMLTTAQINALTTAPNKMMVVDTDTSQIKVRISDAWVAIGGGGGGGPVDEVVLNPITTERIKFYVRSLTGSDENDGLTEETAFATLQHALDVIPTLERSWASYGYAPGANDGRRYVIDVTGLNDVTDKKMPAFSNGRERIFTGGLDNNIFTFEGYVTIQADPTEVVAAATPFSQTPDAVTGLLAVTFDPDPGWTPNDYKGMIAAGTGEDESGVIVSNTSDTLYVMGMYGGSFTPDVRILDQGAQIGPVWMRGVKTSVVFQGCIVQPVAENSDDIMLLCCRTSNLIARNTWRVIFSTGWFEGAGSALWLFDTNYFEMSGLITDQSNIRLESCLFATIASCAMENVAWSGQGRGFNSMTMSRVDVSGSGLSFRQHAKQTLYRANIHDCTGNAIHCEAGELILSGGVVQGSNNTGYGLYSNNFGMIKISPITNVTVTGDLGDMKAGMRAVRTYADFTNNPPVKNEFDYTGDGSRIFDTATAAPMV